MKKKHKIVDAIKFVCQKKETGTLIVVTDDNQFATFGINKGEMVSVSFQGKHGVEAIELVSRIELGVCRFRRDKVADRHDPLPSTDEILTHFRQYNHEANKQKIAPNHSESVEPKNQVNSTKGTLIETLSLEQQRIFETCMAEYIGAMAPILTEEYLEVETDIESAVNNLMLVVRNMSGMGDAKKFNRNIFKQLEATGLRNLSR
jgi:hypothetical protein